MNTKLNQVEKLINCIDNIHNSFEKLHIEISKLADEYYSSELLKLLELCKIINVNIDKAIAESDDFKDKLDDIKNMINELM